MNGLRFPHYAPTSALLLGWLFGCSDAAPATSGGASPGGSSGSAGAAVSAGTGGMLAVAGSGGTTVMMSGGAGGASGSTSSAGGRGNGGSGGVAYTYPPVPNGAFLTTGDLQQGLATVTLNTGAAAKADATVTVDPSTTYQTMNGFGASITDSSSYVMMKYLSADKLKETLTKLFDPAAGAGINFLRQPMGASDFSSTGNFSYDDGDSDPTLASFNLTQDLKATIPILKQVIAINPKIFIMATPWSPPAWMKLNNSMNGSGSGGGNPGLSQDAYEPLAQYFVKFVKGYADQGITVNAVTPQNEPQNGAAAYPGMDLNAPSELTLIAQHLGPAFKAAGLSAYIWAFDHNWLHEDYPETVIGDATAGSFVEAAAFHCYEGDASAMSTFHQHFPMKSIYMTECSGGDWQGGTPLSATMDLEISSIANYAQGISLWNMALDDHKGPTNNGCPNCRGVITVDSGSGDVTYNGDYYGLGHFSKFVRPGALRIGSKSSNGQLEQVAFKNPDGQLVVVAFNSGGRDLVVQIGAGDSASNVTVPGGAAITVTWKPAS